MPPPAAALLRAIVDPTIETPPAAVMPPPLAVALLPLTVERSRTMSPSKSAAMPPPLPEVTRLPVTVEFANATVPTAWIPPPLVTAELSSTTELKRFRVAPAAMCAAPPSVAWPPRRVTPARIALLSLRTSTTRLCPRASMIVVRAPAPCPPDRPAPRIRSVLICSAPRVSR